MANFGPAEQYLNAYTFATVGAGQFIYHWVMLIAANADVGTLTLDGVPVPAGDFTPIPGTEFSSSLQVLQEGTHQTASVNPHGIWVVGYNQDDSYSYPGGALFQSINNEGDPWAPVCSFNFLAGPPPSFSLRATELHPSESGEGFINEETGIFLVELLPGSSNLALNVPAFVPGVTELDFGASLLDANQPGVGTVKVTDGAGNSCEMVLDTQQTQCTEQDISSLLDLMRKKALAQYKYNQRLIKKLLPGQGAAQRSALKRNKKMYQDLLNQVNLIPSMSLQCEESEFCVRVFDNEKKLKKYKRLAKRLASLAKSLMSGACTRSAEECRASALRAGADNKSRKLLSESLQSCSSVPGSTSVCL